MNRMFRRFRLTLSSAFLAIALGTAGFAADDAPPASDPPASDLPTDRPAAGAEAEDDTIWSVTDDPKARHWEIGFVNGTTEQVSATLNAQVLEFDEKLADTLAEIEKQGRDGSAKGDAAKFKSDRVELQRRADTFRARRVDSLAWRQKIVDSIVYGQTIHGALIPGETVGLIMEATVDRVTPEKAVVARFPLLVSAKVVGKVEGVPQIQGTKREVQLLLRKLDDVHKLKRGQKLALPFAFKVTGVEQVEGTEAYVLEPHPCDFNHLLAAIVTRPTLKVPLEKPRPAPLQKKGAIAK